MKILAFIVVISIASVVFYLFLRKAFEGRLDKTADDKNEIKPLLPEAEDKEEAAKEETDEQESKEESKEQEEQEEPKQPEDTNCCKPSDDQEECCEEIEKEQTEQQE